MVCDEGAKGTVILPTIAAIATPHGRGGVGIIRISGAEALSISNTLCQRNAPWKPRHAHYTAFFDAESYQIDQGLLLYFPAPASYTGEDVIEIQAHGSPVLLHVLLNRLFELGTQQAEPGAFTRRAVANGRMNLAQAEAVAACIDAATTRAAKQAQRHLQGEFGHLVEILMHKLTGVLAHLEACLDFPEEEIPALFIEQMQDNIEKEILTPLQQLLKQAPFGERLFAGVHAAIIGAPNVGKSSLMNTLSGRNRAIVSDQAGTTRDILEVDFEVHGIPVRLLDTAGLRENSRDQIEQEGVRRATQAAKTADIVIFVADASRPATWACAIDHALKVMNKVDIPEHTPIPESFLNISVKEGAGITELLASMSQMLGDIDGEEGLLVTHQRHEMCLTCAEKHLQQGMNMLASQDKWDIAALEWRQAWVALGEILGIGDIEHILDRIFSEFCIGK